MNKEKKIKWRLSLYEKDYYRWKEIGLRALKKKKSDVLFSLIADFIEKTENLHTISETENLSGLRSKGKRTIQAPVAKKYTTIYPTQKEQDIFLKLMFKRRNIEGNVNYYTADLLHEIINAGFKIV